MRIVKEFGIKKENAIKLYKRFTDTALFRKFLSKQQLEARAIFGLDG